MLKLCRYSFLFYFAFGSMLYGQNSTSHEAGILIGPSILQSDYGQRNSFSSNVENTGFGVGLVHYLNFSCNAENHTYFKLHFKVRSELSYSKTTLTHYSDWIKNNSNSQDAQQLKAMEAKSSIFNIGSQLEYAPFDKFYNATDTIRKFSPYVSFGFLYTIYSAKTHSSIGEMGSEEATFAKYLVPSDGRHYGFSNEKNSTWSITSSVGTRYKLFKNGDLIVDARLQWFNSDWIDGLNSNKELFPENKSNDWQFWLTFGYVFRL